MRKRRAFWFVPELVGEIKDIASLSKSPVQLYIETSIKTLQTAADIFSLFHSYNDTKRMEQCLNDIKQDHEKQETAIMERFKEEQIREIELQYRSIQDQLSDSKKINENIEKLIYMIEENLRIVIGITDQIKRDDSFKQLCEIDELYRTALRDYTNVIRISMEED